MKWEDLSDPGILKAVEAAIRENRSMKRISITVLCVSVCAKPPKNVHVNLKTRITCVTSSSMDKHNTSKIRQDVSDPGILKAVEAAIRE